MTDKLILSPVTKLAVERLLAHVLEMFDSGSPAIGTEPTVLSHSSDTGQASVKAGRRKTEKPSTVTE
jgi:hypothetical protein